MQHQEYGDFDRGLRYVLQTEGGYSNNKNDRGGRTNKGITQRVYDEYVRKTYGNKPSPDLAHIPSADLRAIYRQFWDPVRGDQLPVEVADVAFDESVNQGPKQATLDLGRALGLANPSERWTPELTQAISSISDPDAVFNRLLQLRREHYLQTVAHRPQDKVFLKGWSNRLRNLQQYEKQNPTRR